MNPSHPTRTSKQNLLTGTTENYSYDAIYELTKAGGPHLLFAEGAPHLPQSADVGFEFLVPSAVAFRLAG
jgi:hypothetical protein